jgi:hypothetical protein
MDDREYQAKAKLYKEIYQHARSKSAAQLHSKYNPAPEAPPESPTDTSAAAEGEMDQESLARLAAMAE